MEQAGQGDHHRGETRRRRSRPKSPAPLCHRRRQGREHAQGEHPAGHQTRHGRVGRRNLEELVYKGYGSGGVAILCEVLTDSRNRTAGEIRKIFELSDGKLGGTGCVAWMFDNKGLFLIPTTAVEEEKLMEVALEAGADDVKRIEDKFEVTCDPTIYRDLSKALADAGITPEASQITRIAKNMVDINDPDMAQKILRLIERLDDHDDVQNVASNFNIPEAVMKAIGEE